MNRMREFDADYYLNGPATGKSNYVDYSWKPDLTLPLADWLKRCMKIKDGDTLLDVACARGYLVKALRMRGVLASGHDISRWAIDNADPEIRSYVSTELNAPRMGWDFVTCKDGLEHIPLKELQILLPKLIQSTRKSFLAIVPLTHVEDGPFLREEDNSDPSHVNCWPLERWIELVQSCVKYDEGFVSGSWHYPGLKPASNQVPKSCGFIQFTRV